MGLFDRGKATNFGGNFRNMNDANLGKPRERRNKRDTELGVQSAANDWVGQQSGLIPPQMRGQMPQGQQIPRFQPQFEPQGDFRSVGMKPMQQASQAYQNQAVNMESPLARIMRMYGGG